MAFRGGMHLEQLVASKICEESWINHVKEEHKSRILNVKPSIDNKSPPVYTHLSNRHKKEQLLEDRYSKIEYENRVLLKKMTHIMSTNYLDNQNVQKGPKSLNESFKKKEAKRIEDENQAILRRLQNRKPYYDHRQWEDHSRNHDYYLENLKEKRARSAPTAASERGTPVMQRRAGSVKNLEPLALTSPKEEIKIEEKSPNNKSKKGTRPLTKEGRNIDGRLYVVTVAVSKKKKKCFDFHAYDMDNSSTATVTIDMDTLKDTVDPSLLNKDKRDELITTLLPHLHFIDGKLVLSPSASLSPINTNEEKKKRKDPKTPSSVNKTPNNKDNKIIKSPSSSNKTSNNNNSNNNNNSTNNNNTPKSPSSKISNTSDNNQTKSPDKLDEKKSDINVSDIERMTLSICLKNAMNEYGLVLYGKNSNINDKFEKIMQTDQKKAINDPLGFEKLEIEIGNKKYSDIKISVFENEYDIDNNNNNMAQTEFSLSSFFSIVTDESSGSFVQNYKLTKDGKELETIVMVKLLEIKKIVKLEGGKDDSESKKEEEEKKSQEEAKKRKEVEEEEEKKKKNEEEDAAAKKFLEEEEIKKKQEEENKKKEEERKQKEEEETKKMEEAKKLEDNKKDEAKKMEEENKNMNPSTAPTVSSPPVTDSTTTPPPANA